VIGERDGKQQTYFVSYNDTGRVMNYGFQSCKDYEEAVVHDATGVVIAHKVSLLFTITLTNHVGLAGTRFSLCAYSPYGRGTSM
jgi:hypothetical protein